MQRLLIDLGEPVIFGSLLAQKQEQQAQPIAISLCETDIVKKMVERQVFNVSAPKPEETCFMISL